MSWLIVGVIVEAIVCFFVGSLCALLQNATNKISSIYTMPNPTIAFECVKDNDNNYIVFSSHPFVISATGETPTSAKVKFYNKLNEHLAYVLSPVRLDPYSTTFEWEHINNS